MTKSSAEVFDPYHAIVTKLINLENASGTAHFSEETLKEAGGASLDLSEIDDCDRALVDLLRDTLVDIKRLLDTDPDALTEDYSDAISSALQNCMQEPHTPVQKLIRDFMNSKFTTLISAIDEYIYTRQKGNKETMDKCIKALRTVAERYLPILTGGK